MNIQPIVNFAQAGLNTDLIPWDLPADYITDIRNIRIKNKKLTPFGGSVRKDDLPSGFCCGLLLSSGKESLWLVAGTDSVYSYEIGTFVDITKAGMLTVDQDLWSGTLISSLPVINNILISPQYCPDIDAGLPMEDLPWDATNTWADAGKNCFIIRSHKQFLFALGVTDSGQYYEEAVRWSAPADTGGVPDSWDPLDTTNVAGFVHLSGEGGKIIDGMTMRDAFVVYREKGITVFDYVGGSFVWQIRHLSTTVGCISPNCIAEVNGTHYFIGDGDIYSNDGNTIESILHNKLRNRFATSFNVNKFTNSYVVNNKLAKEVWFCIPSPEADYPDTAFVFNWKDDTWTIIDMLESPSSSYGKSSDEARSQWDSLEGTWDQMAGTWDKLNSVPFNNTVLSASRNDLDLGGILSLDNNLNGVDTPYISLIERVGYALEGAFKVTSINRAYLHTDGFGSINVELGSQDYPGASVRWSPPVAFEVGADRKVDTRTTGELHSFRFSGEYNLSSWSMSGFDLIFTEAGTR